MTALVPAIVLTIAVPTGGPAPRPEGVPAASRTGLPATAQATADIETIVRDNMSNVEEAKQAVARTPAEWAALWRLHDGDRKPPPTIDLTKRTVVAVFLGARPSAGYAVEVSGIKQAGTTSIVEWRESVPKPGNVSAQVITSPSHLVSIPKVEGEITFRKVEP